MPSFPQLDSKTGNPLFNKRAWAKANNVLIDILEGNAADPPGVNFYFQSLDAKGEPAFDEHGFALLVCNRGTNDVENSHKHIVTSFGTWMVGVETSDHLLAERRHRLNHRISELKRAGFPKFGHYDTWLIDKLQVLVELNHGVHLFSTWTNTADFANTTEAFGTVRIHSDELDAALQQIELGRQVTEKFTPDQKYLCRRMGTPAPLLPVHGEEECKLFDLLVRTTHVNLDFDQMAIDWCDKVDGVTIFPKLPVYLRTHHTAWLRNQAVRDAVRAAESGEAELRRLNEQTALQIFPQPAAGATAAVAPARHPAIRPANHPTAEDTQVVVAGMLVGGQPSDVGERRGVGKRKRDRKPRQPRTCVRCSANGRSFIAATCNGATGRGQCQHKKDADKISGKGK